MSPQESAKERREKAAAARAEQLAAEKRRDRMIKIIGGLAVVLVVGGIVGGAYIASKNSGGNVSPSASGLPGPNPDAALPKGVSATGDQPYGVPLGTPKAGAPTLAVWEDFQCPICGVTEKANGTGIEELGTSGKAALYYRPLTFLDANLAAQNAAAGTQNSSARATAAWGCAIDQDKAREYHNVLYANQPQTEGDGYTDQQLLDFGKQAGLAGAAYTSFEGCVKANTYLGWAVNSNNEMGANNITGTPTGVLNGTQLPQGTLADKAKLDAAVAAATK
jgi:protein-disulfide isomerase